MKELKCKACIRLVEETQKRIKPGYQGEIECQQCGTKLIVDGDTKKVYLGHAEDC